MNPASSKTATHEGSGVASKPSATQGRARPGTLLLAGLAVGGLGLLVYRQGFHLLHDGHWLLATQVLAEKGTLYRDLVTPGGPGRYLLLLPFYLLLGHSALSLAVLRAVATGAAAALAYGYARRAGARSVAWVTPAAVLAVGPIPPHLVLVSALAWLVQRALEAPASSRRWLAVAATWGVLTTFGLRGAGLGLCVVFLARAFGPRSGRWPRRGLLVAAAGPMVALAAMAGVLAARGALGAAAFDAVRSPMAQLADRLASTGVSGWLHTFQSGPIVTRPFDGLDTGEGLGPAWPGHAGQRAVSVRLLLLLAWGIPATGLVLHRRASRRRAAAPSPETGDGLEGILALAVTGWISVLLQCDGASLRLIWLACAILLPVCLTRRPPGVRWGPAATVVIAGAGFGPLLAETSWLAVHGHRPGLERWSRTHAGIDLGHRRIENLEAVFHSIDAVRGQDAALIWPIEPGLYTLMDVPRPTRQVVLLPHTVQDAGEVQRELEETRPGVAVLGMDTSYERALLRNTAPSLWSYLRHQYAVMGNVVNRPDEFRVLRRVDGGYDQILELPLPERLPQLELGVSNDVGPAMRKGFTVGQTFLVADTDLAGIAVRWKTSGRPIETQIRIDIWQRGNEGYTTLLDFVDVDLTIPQSFYRSFIRFDEPVPETAGKDLAVTLELREDTADEIRLLWHRHDVGDREADLYPAGTAVVNLAPVAADLYFMAY